MYLSDVSAGGETHFPFSVDLRERNVTISPKKGRALLFPNVYDDGMFVEMNHYQNPAEATTLISHFAGHSRSHQA
jgi:hypothetical protein